MGRRPQTGFGWRGVVRPAGLRRGWEDKSDDGLSSLLSYPSLAALHRFKRGEASYFYLQEPCYLVFSMVHAF